MKPAHKAILIGRLTACAISSDVSPNTAMRSKPTTTKILSSLPCVAFSQSSVNVMRFDRKARDDAHEAGSLNPCSPTMPLRTSIAFSQLVALKNTQDIFTKPKVTTHAMKAFILKFTFFQRRQIMSAVPCKRPQKTNSPPVPCHNPHMRKVNKRFLNSPELAKPVSPQGNIHVVPQKSTQRHVPSPPKVLNTCRPVRSIEVDR